MTLIFTALNTHSNFFFLAFDLHTSGLIIHEGSSVYRIFKRWQAVNQKWKVLNYDKAKDLGDPSSSSSKGAARVERDSSHTVTDSSRGASRHVRTILNNHCGYTVLHFLSQLRPNNLHNSSHEVVMRVTTVWGWLKGYSRDKCLLGFN